ncbi:hypothetical protein H0A36_28500 [Endozoicomonas sp. SM1973]|uniref:Uncharacterized protein n=1 Tax=Spartinivicinus marinus TaxID=2994442 RepID=A0A853IHH0_9GAMM|nr:hypothetical protein [Spartinivicinus marinus]NYZ69958.1 hypothetical protein [Spartinivicinus marinus]
MFVCPENYSQITLPKRNGEKSSHTETKALARVNFKPGDTMVISGQRDPCKPCRGSLNKYAKANPGVKILYKWRENGETWVWEAGRGLIQKGSIKAEPGNKLKWD